MKKQLMSLLALLVLIPALAQAEEAITLFAAKRPEATAIIDVYGTTDTGAMRPLIEDFQRLQPTLAVRYYEYTTNELDQRFRAQADAGAPQADLLISSAMDLQVRLVNDGYARTWRSDATAWLPAWARWRDQAFGFTFEPAVIVYDPRRLSPEHVPATRFELIRLLRENPVRFSGRVGTYDIEASGVGYLFASQDSLQSSTFGRLIESLGRIGVRLACCTSELLAGIERGELLLAYNVLGSYAQARIAQGAPLAVMLPKDYTLIMARVALIPLQAPNAEAAGRLLDYLLSARGQALIAQASYLYALNPEVSGGSSAQQLNVQVDGPLRPIGLGPGLLVYLDRLKRERFLKEWRASVYPAD
jgi:two-component system sensor histidine kinase TctE